MEKLTTEQRNNVYKKALNASLKPLYDENLGLCALIKWECSIDTYLYYKLSDDDDRIILPELKLFINTLFPKLNWEERQLILMFCIEMTN